MKVLIVAQGFWPERFRVNDLAVDLVGRGHQVTVLTGEPSYPNRSAYPGYGGWRRRCQDYAGVQVRRVPVLTRGNGPGWRLALNYLSFALSASVLGPPQVPRDVDAIFVFQPSPVTVGIPGVVLKWLTGAPVVFWVQDPWPETLEAVGAVRSRLVLSGVRRLVRWIYGNCDRVLVQSRGFLPHALANGAQAEDVSYVPNWAETAYGVVCAREEAPERALLPDGFVVMFAGNLGTAQSLPTLLEAAQLLRGHEDIHWVVLGDGSRRRWLEDQVAARGLSGNVHLLGSWPVEKMPTFFALADALLVTLARKPIYALTIPSKVQSYLAAGRPVLAALDGEGRRVVEDAGAGLAVPAEDAEGLARSVLALKAMSPQERDRLGGAGRSYFLEHFDRDRLLGQLEKVLIETAGV